MPCQAQNNSRVKQPCPIYTKKCGPHTSLIHTPRSRITSHVRTSNANPQWIWYLFVTPLYTMMPHSKIILNAVFTIAFLTWDLVVQTKIIQVASLGVKSALVNTNQYICLLSILTSGSTVCDCKDNIFLSYILHFILKSSKIKSF